jgi:hypothetical protein
MWRRSGRHHCLRRPTHHTRGRGTRGGRLSTTARPDVGWEPAKPTDPARVLGTRASKYQVVRAHPATSRCARALDPPSHGGVAPRGETPRATVYRTRGPWTLVHGQLVQRQCACAPRARCRCLRAPAFPSPNKPAVRRGDTRLIPRRQRPPDAPAMQLLVGWSSKPGTGNGRAGPAPDLSCTQSPPPTRLTRQEPAQRPLPPSTCGPEHAEPCRRSRHRRPASSASAVLETASLRRPADTVVSEFRRQPGPQVRPTVRRGRANRPGPAH